MFKALEFSEEELRFIGNTRNCLHKSFMVNKLKKPESLDFPAYKAEK